MTSEDKLYENIIQTDKNMENKQMYKNYHRMGRESTSFEIPEKESSPYISFPFHF